jgi:hypothetical protein
MKLITASTITVLALLLALDSISAARATHYTTPAKCPPAHAHIFIADEQAQVYYGAIYTETIYGCTDGKHRVEIGSTPMYAPDGSAGVELVRLAGSDVTFMELDSGTFYIVVVNLRTGKVLHKALTGPYRKGNYEPNSGGNSPAQALVIKSDGSVAWIASNVEKYVNHAYYYELHVIDKLGSRTITAGTEINPTSLALAGSTLYWTQGGKAMSAPLE